MKMMFSIFVALISFSACQCQTTTFTADDALLTQMSNINLHWLESTSVPEAARFVKFKPTYNIESKASLHPQHSELAVDLFFNKSVIDVLNKTSEISEFLSKCSDDLVQILFNLKSEWALKMLDSNGKLMSGLLLGSLTWPGNYKECESVYSPLDERDHGDFYGQYCMTSWKSDIMKNFTDFPINIGVCVPSSCNKDDIITAATNVLRLSGHMPLMQKIAKQLILDSVTCKTGVNSPDAAVIVYLVIIFAFLALVLCGTSITAYAYFTPGDIRNTRRFSEHSYAPLNSTTPRTYGAAVADPLVPEKVPESCGTINSYAPENHENHHVGSKKSSSVATFFTCFCAFTNGNKILSVDAPSRQLISIHGIRFLSLTWVISGHTYITAVSYISNKLDTQKEIDSFFFQMMMQAPMSVDSFFLLSGTLLAYMFLKEADHRNGKINWAYFYLHRIWRLTPVYMLIVGFYILVFKYMGSGPYWDDNHGDSCRGTWWWYLLYINNFIPIREMCVGWSWYLANDMQFYLVSPLYLYILWKWNKIGITLISLLMAGSWIITGVLTSKYDIIPLLAGVTKVHNIADYENRMWNAYDIIYDKPYCRISPYLVGVLLGYALHITRNKQHFLSKWQQVLGWVLATFCSASVIFGLYHVHLTETISVLYNAMSRTSFVLGLAWLIFACETGHGGIIYKLLSWKVWIPLSRLTYCAYLVHPLLIHGYYQGLQTVFYFTHTTVITLFLGFLVASYFLAFAVSIAFESPMMNLEKLFLKRTR